MVGDPIRHKRDQLKQFRAFCTAARFENMTKAADELSVSQRAIALQVRSLEGELETELFERNGPRLALTLAGKRLYQLAQPLVEELDSLADAFAEKRSELVSANIELAVAPVASVVLPVSVGRFMEEHPRAHIRVTHCAVRDGLRHLADGRVDLVVGPRVTGTEFVYRPLYSYELLVVVSEEHPLAGEQSAGAEQARRYPAVLPAVGAYGPGFEDAVAARLSVAARVAVESSGWGVMKSFVRAGNGIAVMPSCCIARRDRLRAVRIDGYSYRHDSGVFTPRHQLSLSVVDFVEHLGHASAAAVLVPGMSPPAPTLGGSRDTGRDKPVPYGPGAH